MTTEVKGQERKLGLPPRVALMGHLPCLQRPVFSQHPLPGYACLALVTPTLPRHGPLSHGSAFSAEDGQPALVLQTYLTSVLTLPCPDSGQAAILPGLDPWSLGLQGSTCCPGPRSS